MAKLRNERLAAHLMDPQVRNQSELLQKIDKEVKYSVYLNMTSLVKYLTTAQLMEVRENTDLHYNDLLLMFAVALKRKSY
jgi:hypothetical protein